MYNLTNVQNSLTVSELAVNLNSLTNNTMFGAFIIAFFFVTFYLLKSYDFLKAFTSSCFVTFFVSILMWRTQLVSAWFPAIFFIFFVIGGLMLYIDQSYY